MKRLALCLLFLMLSAHAVPGRSDRGSSDPPNVLFIIGDDHRADALGVEGAPVRTPNLDRLAGSGTRFTNLYCQGAHHGAVCSPSRAMLMTGLSYFRIGDKIKERPTLGSWFRERGYRTFGTGKWHNEKAAFLRSFDEGRAIFFGGMSDHFQVPFQDLEDGRLTTIERDGFSTRKIADAAVEFLNRQEGDEPFLAYVSFTAPHDPRSPDVGYENACDPESLPLPPNFLPQHPFRIGNMGIRDEVLAPWPRTPEVIRSQLAEYYALVIQIDDEIGRLLDALETRGLAENTIIVYTSDHGLALGSHGLLGKQSVYEHSMKAPGLITGPGLTQGTTFDGLSYLYDLFPTLCGLADIDHPQGLDGIDLEGCLKQEEPAPRKHLLLAYRDCARAIRDDRYKLIRYPKVHITQLFDLEQDPAEKDDLSAEASHQKRMAVLLEEMKRQQGRFGDDAPLLAETRESPRFDPSLIKRVPDRHQPESVRKKYFPDPDKQER